MAVEFVLPELGENIHSGTVTKVMISAGSIITVDQPVVELETDKAALEVPSSIAGTVSEVRVKEGDVVKVGAVIFVVADGAASGASQPSVETPRPKPSPPPIQKPEPVTPPPKVEAPAPPAAPAPRVESAPVPPRENTGDPVPAAPSVRRLAREIGVDINVVPGSGPGGRVSEEDVKVYARQLREGNAVTGISNAVPAPSPPLAPIAAPSAAPKLPDFASWGEIERLPMTAVRRLTAEHMTLSWTTIPHVTQFDKVDVTELEELRKRFGPRVEQAGGKLTITAMLLKVLAAALVKFPPFNASVDAANHQVILKKYYSIGVAVDTDRGLLVPVLRAVDQKTITEIAVELTQLAQRARARKLMPDEMHGGTFTVSNLGGIGGTAFTPIVNSPEVAILGISRSHIEPVYKNDRFEPRTLLPLSLSYDHRVIDGADGARFLRWVCEALEQPFMLFLDDGKAGD